MVYFFLKVLKVQTNEVLKLLEADNIEALLSQKQLALWQWALARREREFARRHAAEALGFPERTVEDIIKKLNAYPNSTCDVTGFA